MTKEVYDEKMMRNWHIQFEKAAPGEHLAFLKFLQISEEEIETIRRCLLYLSATHLTGEKKRTNPRPESDQDQHVNYPVALLRLALQQSGASYTLRAGEHVFMQARALTELENNREIDVVWSMTSIEREERLLPIGIPIYKGLIGWRLLLVQQNKTARFQQIDNLEQLHSLTAGQGHDWPDTTILRKNGLKVYGASSYEGLFKMLAMGRIDYFPRSLIETWNEYQTHKDRESQFIRA